MAILSLDDYIAAKKQRVILKKTGTRTTVANTFYSMFDIAGNPGAGTLGAGNTANGLVPTDAVSGYPGINAFDVGANGYLGRIGFNGSTPARLHVYDRLFVAGAYTFNANVNLASQPSFASRVPNTDYKGLEIWVETVTTATGNLAVNVGYTKEDGTTGRSTGAVGVGAAPVVGRCWQLPLQAGDKGVQRIDSVVGSVATAATFNVMILRPLWSGRVVSAGFGDIHDAFGKVGLPNIYADSALYALVGPDGTSSGTFELNLDVVNG